MVIKKDDDVPEAVTPVKTCTIKQLSQTLWNTVTSNDEIWQTDPTEEHDTSLEWGGWVSPTGAYFRLKHKACLHSFSCLVQKEIKVYSTCF